MDDHQDRERYIPLCKNDLIDLLCEDGGLPPQEAESFCLFGDRVTAACHRQYQQRLEKLKADYTPFDPDADTKCVFPLREEERQRKQNELYREFTWLMEHAQYKHLSCGDIEPTLGGASDWGFRMDLDFSVFERLAIFVRGDALQRRVKRRLRSLFRVREVELPIYQRLVMLIKLRPHRRLGKDVKPDCVYFQIFKNIPKLDIKMLLPGARVRFSGWDRVKVAFTVASGLGLAAWNVVRARTSLPPFALLGLDIALLGLIGGTLGYLVKSYLAFQQTKQRLHLSLTQILFYQNLDTNSGVLYRLLDEAEDQECREVLLAYYFLWRHAGEGGWTAAELDGQATAYLERHTGAAIGCELADAVAQLERQGVVEKVAERYRARPLAEALERFEEEHGPSADTNHARPEPPAVPTHSTRKAAARSDR
jgi:hypothetical protein